MLVAHWRVEVIEEKEGYEMKYMYFSGYLVYASTIVINYLSRWIASKPKILRRVVKTEWIKATLQ